MRKYTERKVSKSENNQPDQPLARVYSVPCENTNTSEKRELVKIMLDTACESWYMQGMETPTPRQEQPQQYYSYAEIALLCRRSPATIMSMASRLKLPRFRQSSRDRRHRICLFDLPTVQRLQRLTVLRQYGQT